MTYDLSTVRAQFPALALEDNAKPRIYFDNPGGTQVPSAVIERMSDCLIHANANLGGYFPSSVAVGKIVAEAHQAMADFLNAQAPEEIIIGQNMTSLTFHMSRSIGKLMQPGDEIVLTRMDHDANVTPWVLLARDLSLTVKWLEFNTDTFEFDLARLDDVLTPRTRLLCVNYASNLTGTINDVQAIALKAKQVGAMVYVDAVQYAPHGPIDVQTLGCDFLVCSAYKFFGPHQGILWGRKDLLERLQPYKVRPAPDSLPGRFETGTQSHEGMAGISAAVDYFAWIGETMAQAYHEHYSGFQGRRRYVHAAMDYLFAYETTLTQQLLAGLQTIPGLKIQGISDPTALQRRVPTVSFTRQGHHPATIAKALAAQNIFIWSGHNYAVEVAAALGVLDSGGVVRVGLAHYNSADEVEHLLAVLTAS